MKDHVLEVQDLNVELGGKKVIENLKFNVEQGEALVVLGPNGAGKTVLMRTLLGLVPYKGKIYWKEGLEKSYVPTKLPLERDFPLTVRDFFNLKKVDFKNIKETLESVGMGIEVLDRAVNHLSTGQFQRILVGWGLCEDPDVLLFDEPVFGIDVAGQENIYQLLGRLQRERDTTMILVSHDLNIVYSLADKALCLNRKVVCYGHPQEIISPQVLAELYGGKIKFYKHLHE